MCIVPLCVCWPFDEGMLRREVGGGHTDERYTPLFSPIWDLCDWCDRFDFVLSHIQGECFSLFKKFMGPRFFIVNIFYVNFCIYLFNIFCLF